MRRFLFTIALTAAGPAAAWEFSPSPVCTLRHSDTSAETVITFEPGSGLYTLSVTRTAGDWTASPSFGMAFAGGAALTIGTDRHQTEGPRLTVSDTGFGNVLNGLEFNSTAVAFTPLQQVEIPLDGAAEPVQAFRACTKSPPVTS